MKELDFLPEWYKEGKRRRMHMRRQYAILAIFFLAMVTYNTLVTRRISRANAELTRLEDQRYWAEGILHEYDAVSKRLEARRAKVASVQQVDGRIDVAAVLAEISYIIGDPIVLSRLEFVAEPFPSSEKPDNRGKSGVRSAGASRGSAKATPLGPTRFRVALAGIAVDSAEVAALVSHLGKSPYFDQVNPLLRDNTIQVGAAMPQASPATDATAKRKDARSVNVTEFEITCYLANYEERDQR